MSLNCSHIGNLYLNLLFFPCWKGIISAWILRCQLESSWNCNVTAGAKSFRTVCCQPGHSSVTFWSVTDCLLLLPFANYVTARGLLKEGPKKNFSKEIIPKLVIFIFLSNKGFEIFHSVQHMFSNSGIKALCMQQKIFKLKIYGKFVRGVVWLKLQDITKITSPSFNISRGNLFLAYLRFITIWHYFSNAMQFMPLAKME